jgi:AcrR family transcriptional regulator
MTDSLADPFTEIGEARHAADAPARRPLTRQRIVDAGLRVIDEQGLEALTMRKLAQDLGVDPMSLYRHFTNKDALLDGVADTLWGEVALPEGDVTWAELLRAMAISLRALAHAHPHAYALLLNRQIVPLATLRLFDVALERLLRAGFARERVAQIVCTVSSFALGYAMVELSALLPPPSGRAGAEEMTGIGRFSQVMRRLPRETPPHLAEVACAMLDGDADAQFTFGLDLMLTSLTVQSASAGQRLGEEVARAQPKVGANGGNG